MWLIKRGYRLDDVLSGLPLTASMLSDVLLANSPQNLLALLLFLGRHADDRARAVVRFNLEGAGNEHEPKERSRSG